MRGHHHGQQTVGGSSYLSELRSLIPVVFHHVAVPKEGQVLQTVTINVAVEAVL